MRLRIALAAGLIAAPAFAGDHLVPKEGDPAFLVRDYDRITRLVMAEVFAPDVTVRFVVADPRGADYALGIRRRGGKAEILGLRAPEALFSYAEIDDARHKGASARDVAGWIDMLKPGHDDPKDVVPDRCALPVSNALAHRIEAIWDAVLAGTRPDPAPRWPKPQKGAPEKDAPKKDAPKIGIYAGPSTAGEGTEYEFSNRAGAAGTIYSPRAEGALQDVIALAGRMDRLCAAHDAAGVKALGADARALSRRLLGHD